MPSFDVVSRVDVQHVDNAVNNAMREIGQRYDFRGTHNEIRLDRKELVIHILAADKLKMEAAREIFLANCVRQQLDAKAFSFGEPEPTSGGALKREVRVRQGIEKETAQKLVKLIKDTKLKVQPAIQGDELRVSGKKIDDLQAVMAVLREQDLDIALQFINLRK